MSTPRVIGYDDLHGYLEEMAEEANSMAREADDDGEYDAREFYKGRAAAFDQVATHIEHELEWNRA